ncbi:MAG TPA: tRNA (adenosine(37)-N6)-threonylcarbamoyltransferase complex ATPase subunit type 1 TsaE [Bacteroidales bacterium]|jgi:tRNA threonylcarbamoyladenosine biosynthesis protein TsaE|nr:tRNA (adenosine(37)-N6)-threonylcarbamoyltransferase complex ATPase subunit type 1 TsaE [Bacteroidales bacterium]OQB59960.1 MAG: tRNA threonylcarbamoyladenosine biosynthesis protein TsaE [Bacteroidetes bacterium ADurb.Bin145]NMD02018.1 tRNA (adenosine(37)-N6)-threonylcarbamoyltransferase complex ATPase subunit type 1 TsaE [Bacteroidales bacterium]HOU02087.1 tRNA (adenosine(37)-N6)-threonylcarbamoyltransferase complex ATPase subunit type 1 TsaE [Bacteroidales bacterium]HQG62189.1 tRNA (adenos
MILSVRNKRELQSVVRKILDHAAGGRIFAFYGTLGAGKTTIIKVFCEILGAADLVSSPTFTIVNEYRTVDGDSLYHIDFYRINKKDEVYDFGIEEYLSAGSYCFIEWPGIIDDMLPQGTIKVRITVGEDGERILNID